jgi:hypothetical protein
VMILVDGLIIDRVAVSVAVSSSDQASEGVEREIHQQGQNPPGLPVVFDDHCRECHRV